MFVKLQRTALVLVAILAACRHAQTAYVPHDPELRAMPVYFYPATSHADEPRPVVFFFGNDVGFWEAHQKLAERLAGDGYSVIGFDVRDLLKSLPDSSEAAREEAYVAEISKVIARSRHE